MAKVNKVLKAAKDYPHINVKKGEPYFWWKFRHGSRVMSKTYPHPSQLTQSEFLGEMMALEESIGELSFNDPSEVTDWIQETKDRMEELRDAQEEKKGNMPEGLQEGPIGEMLQARYDSLEDLINELDNIEADYEDPSDEDMRAIAMEELGIDDDDDAQTKAEMEDEWNALDDEIETQRTKHATAWIDERVEEIQNITISYE